MKHNLLLLINFLIVLTSCNGQNNQTKLGKPTESLSDAIMVIYQDQKNNYWFGSRGEGAFRYDGKNILQFTTKDGLVSNNIWGIQEDKAGNIYFDTQDGISKFDGQKFVTLNLSKASNSEWKLEPDDLWFKGNWNQNGVYRYDGENLHRLECPKNVLADKLYTDSPNMTWSPYGIYSLYKDKQGAIWFGTSNLGIYRYDGKKLSHLYEDHLTNTKGGGSFGIRSMIEDSQGKFWFCNTQYRYTIHPNDSIINGMHAIHYQSEKGIEGLKSSNGDFVYYLSITEDHNRNLWMVTYDEGIWKYDGKNTTHYTVKHGTKDSKLFTIYKDKQGNLWVGSHDSGVYKFNGSVFEKFKL